MPKLIKHFLISLFGVLVLAFIAFQGFMYKVKNGFPKDQTEMHGIDIPDDRPTILVFSKTTAFRHSAAIVASKSFFSNLAVAKNWFLYETEDAGIFNEDELPLFDVVVWNNSSGPVLTEQQQELFEEYILNGGAFIGIHAAGDASHHKWNWYVDQLIGAQFSHHPILNHIQRAEISINKDSENILSQDLPKTWMHDEEWYVFYDSPDKNGFSILCSIDGNAIDPNGNILFEKSKNFGMGTSHPIAWYKNINHGKSFYTSMGHQAKAFDDLHLQKLITNAIRWGMNDGEELLTPQ